MRGPNKTVSKPHRKHTLRDRSASPPQKTFSPIKAPVPQKLHQVRGMGGIEMVMELSTMAQLPLASPTDEKPMFWLHTEGPETRLPAESLENPTPPQSSDEFSDTALDRVADHARSYTSAPSSPRIVYVDTPVSNNTPGACHSQSLSQPQVEQVNNGLRPSLSMPQLFTSAYQPPSANGFTATEYSGMKRPSIPAPLNLAHSSFAPVYAVPRSAPPVQGHFSHLEWDHLSDVDTSSK